MYNPPNSPNETFLFTHPTFGSTELPRHLFLSNPNDTTEISYLECKRYIIIDPGVVNLGVLIIDFFPELKQFRKKMKTINLTTAVPSFRYNHKREIHTEAMHSMLIRNLKPFIDSFSDYDKILYDTTLIIEDQATTFRLIRSVQILIEMYLLTKGYVQRITRISALQMRIKLSVVNTREHKLNKKLTKEAVLRTSIFDHLVSAEEEELRKMDEHLYDCIGLLFAYIKDHCITLGDDIQGYKRAS